MKLKCSFSGPDSSQGETLFKGLPQRDIEAQAYICGDCITQCWEQILHSRLSADLGSAAPSGPSPER